MKCQVPSTWKQSQCLAEQLWQAPRHKAGSWLASLQPPLLDLRQPPLNDPMGLTKIPNTYSTRQLQSTQMPIPVCGRQRAGINSVCCGQGVGSQARSSTALSFYLMREQQVESRFSQEAFKWRQIRDLCAHLMEGTVLKTENKVQGRTEK